MTHWDIARAIIIGTLAGGFWFGCALAGYLVGGLVYLG
jgi:hypothetical protein